MKLDFIRLVPPMLQIIIVIIIGVAALVSVIYSVRQGSISETGKIPKFFEYVLVPILTFVVLLIVIIANWDSSVPFWGESAWWNSVGRKVGVVIIGMIPAALCLGALFRVSTLAKQTGAENPLDTSYGVLYLILVFLTAIILPVGIGGAILFDKFYLMQ